MSGHSHFATIKRQKEAKDAARGNIFSKLASAITIAAKSGPDPNSNFKLRVEIDRAKAANMPKENIERAIARASAAGEVIEEVTYEGFGPGGIAVMVEAATDNRNRTSQEIKNLFERGGGGLAGPGSVSFNFEPRGLVLVPKGGNVEEQMLKLIDLGVEEMEETGDGIEVYVSPDKLAETKKKIEEASFSVSSFELIQKPKSFIKVENPSQATKIVSFLESLSDHDDVQKVFANVEIPDEVLRER